MENGLWLGRGRSLAIAMASWEPVSRGYLSQGNPSVKRSARKEGSVTRNPLFLPPAFARILVTAAGKVPRCRRRINWGSKPRPNLEEGRGDREP